MKQVDDLRKQGSMKLYQVWSKSKLDQSMGEGFFVPIRGPVFTSVNEAKIYMASHALYPIVWKETGCEEYPATGADARSTGFEYMMVGLSVFGNDAVVVPTEKIRAMREIIDRMERRLIAHGDIEAAVNWLEGYPGQTAQQIADHKMDGDL